jgi:SAM-dependent methyltransferase
MNETSPLIPVAQSYGWTSTIPNPMSCKFFDLVKNIQNPRVIDIGAGYGVASIPAMEAGAYVIVNDIDQSQLDHIADLVREKNFQRQCQFLNAALPNLPDILQLDAIHASNVLHFLTGDEIVLTAKWMYRNLKNGGKVFLQMQSPWCGQLHSFLSEYEMRKASGLKWPGEIDDVTRYALEGIRHMMADFNHVLEAEIVADTFREVGFTIEYADYYTRPGLPEVCRFDGRENLGVVVVKN